MIHDSLQNLSRYTVPQSNVILAFLKSRDPKSVVDGEHEIEGRNLFVRVMSNELKPAAENQFEAHEIYADLQYVAEGVELMQTVPADKLSPPTAQDLKGDYQFFKASDGWTDIVVRAGEFVVFFPGEAHRPGCLYKDHRGKIKKLVFKIKMR